KNSKEPDTSATLINIQLSTKNFTCFLYLARARPGQAGILECRRSALWREQFSPATASCFPSAAIQFS
ncbi:MAG: hypothetical protein EBY25_04450, partial [Betaproteobacteria bacterium]|nr:hypothetical protein [Betaproteobacteria bacterium]